MARFLGRAPAAVQPGARGPLYGTLKDPLEFSILSLILYALVAPECCEPSLHVAATDTQAGVTKHQAATDRFQQVSEKSVPSQTSAPRLLPR